MLIMVKCVTVFTSKVKAAFLTVWQKGEKSHISLAAICDSYSQSSLSPITVKSDRGHQEGK